MEGLNQLVRVLHDEIIVSVDSQTQDFAAVNGDTDKSYFMEFFLKNNNVGSATYTLRLNTANIAADRQSLQLSAAIATAARDANPYFAVVPTGKTCSGVLWIPKATTGSARHVILLLAFSNSVALEGWQLAYDISTPNTATNITSIGIGSDVADGIGINSEMRLYRNR